MELLAVGFVGLTLYSAYKVFNKESEELPSCSVQDVEKYSLKLESIINKSVDKVKGAETGYSTRLDDSRFGRTGYHDEDEWKTYKAILYSKGIKSERISHTGIDSSIKLTVI